MDVKTFEAYSMKDAVKSVKKELGAEAVILSTREKPAPNGKGTIYEVTAAAQGMRKSGASSNESHSGHQGRDLANDVEALGARLSTLADTAATRTQVQAIEASMQELKLLLLEALRTKDGSTLHDLPKELIPLERQMRIMGVGDVTIAELMRHLRSLPEGELGADAEAYCRDQAIRWMMKRIKIAPRWPVMPGAVSYQVVIGPTGVGKTSLTAKLAAMYALREKNKVLVVSLDHHRLAASEQMRIFCKIIGVPFVAAGGPDDLLSITTQSAQAKDTELVLVDTAGISPKNASALRQLAELKATGLPVDFHLCLSVTERESQLEQEIKAFLSLGLTSLVFSKLDESWAFGEIFNISRKWAIPLSFFSIGQQIPEDLERATRERVIERIFGL